MGSNVIPLAPESSIYPQLPQHDFRMQKANEIATDLNAEVVHYRVVAKNINEPRKLSTEPRLELAFFLLLALLQV